MSSSCHMEQKTFIEASCNNNIHTGEKFFYSSYVWRFGSRFFLDRVKKLVVYLVYMTFFRFPEKIRPIEYWLWEVNLFFICR